jgi:L-Ala-D/L-Glu epimerase
MTKISQIEILRLQLPLETPYLTSLGEFAHYDTVFVIITLENGEFAIGESTAVKGYSWESPEDVWIFVKTHAGHLVNKKLEEANRWLTEKFTRHPFSLTPFITAFEQLKREPIFCVDRDYQVELLGIINSQDFEEIDQKVYQLYKRGYKTIKVKVGWDVRTDIEKVKFIHDRIIDKGMKIRIDANQAFSYYDAYKFVTTIPPDHIELFEQPFKEGNWGDMTKLSKHSPIPLMLDESIYDMNDIDKAIKLQCAEFIKLKLMKVSSAELFSKMVKKIQEFGIEVVFGNGIATDIGCYQEAILSANLGLETAGEMNGFLKTVTSVSERAIDFEKNSIYVSSDFIPKIDKKKIQPFITNNIIYD